MKYDPGRRKFLKAAGIAAGAVIGGKAIQKSIEYFNDEGQENKSKRQAANDKSKELAKISSSDDKEKGELRRISQNEGEAVEPTDETFLDTDIDEARIGVMPNEESMTTGVKEKGGTPTTVQRKDDVYESKQKDDDLESWADESGKKDVLSVIKKKYGGRIRLACKETKLAPELLTGLIAYESHGKERAKSKSNAFGLTQLKKGTAKSVNVKNVFHPYENIVGGARYLRQMLDRFGDMNSALAAYNMGPGALDKKLKSGYNPKTNDYAKRVLYLASLL